MIIAGYISGGTFRLLSDQASAAVVAAAEQAALDARAAQQAAEAARDEAVEITGIDTVADYVAARELAYDEVNVVRDFGADNTGATSVSAAFEAAAAAVNAKSGGEIRLIHGTYVANEQIDVDFDNVSWVGPGGDAATVRRTAANQHVFYLKNVSGAGIPVKNVAFRGFCIDGMSIDDSSDDYDLIRIRYALGVRIRDMILRNGGCAIRVSYSPDNPNIDDQRSKDVRIEGSTFENNRYFCIQSFGVEDAVYGWNTMTGGARSVLSETAAIRSVWGKKIKAIGNFIDYYNSSIPNLGANGGILMTGDNTAPQEDIEILYNTIAVSGGPAMSLRGPMLRPIIKGNKMRAGGRTMAGDAQFCAFYMSRKGFDPIVDLTMEDNSIVARGVLATTVAHIEGALISEQGGIRRNVFTNWGNRASGAVYGLNLVECGGLWPVEQNTFRADFTGFVAARHAAERSGFVGVASKNTFHLPGTPPFASTAFAGSKWLKGNGYWRGWNGAVASGAPVDDNSYITAPQQLSGGANLGDMTDGGGLAVVFDGVRSKNFTASARKAASISAYAGKSYSADLGISHVHVTAPNDHGFIRPSDASITLRLYGKAGATPPATVADGDLLSTAVLVDTTGQQKLENMNAGVGYRHVWVRISTSEPDQDIGLAQLEIYGYTS